MGPNRALCCAARLIVSSGSNAHLDTDECGRCNDRRQAPFLEKGRATPAAGAFAEPTVIEADDDIVMMLVDDHLLAQARGSEWVMHEVALAPWAGRASTRGEASSHV